MTDRDFTTFVDSIEVAVRDLESAVRDMELILDLPGRDLGVQRDPFSGTASRVVEYEPGGIRSLRLAAPVSPGDQSALTEFLDERGEGMWSIRLLVDDLDERIARAESVGVRFSSEPIEFDGGRAADTVRSTTDGVRYEYVSGPNGLPNDKDIYVRAIETKTRVQRAYVLDLAVSDLKAGMAKYAGILDIEGVVMDPAMDPSDSMDGCHFPTGGLYNIGLLSPRGTPNGPIPQAAHDYIVANDSDGVFLLGFHVDIDAKEAQLRERGVPLVFDQPIEYKIGRMSMTSPMHGVSWFYGQWVEGGYEIWREELEIESGR